MLKKTLAISDCEFKFIGNDRTFEGYASVFGGVDSYNDTIIEGAFKNTLENRSAPVKMFFNHKSWEFPVGKWLSMQEDSKGLLVKGELTPNHKLADDLYASMKHGTVDGLSIGFRLDKNDVEFKDDIRIIKQVTELVEISPVIFPADDAARIALDTVKSELDGINSVQDFEHFLRDAGGFSNALAKTLVSKAKDILQREVGDLSESKLNAELQSFAQANARLKEALRSF